MSTTISIIEGLVYDVLRCAGDEGADVVNGDLKTTYAGLFGGPGYVRRDKTISGCEQRIVAPGRLCG